jgi:hypothetical protein
MLFNLAIWSPKGENQDITAAEMRYREISKETSRRNCILDLQYSAYLRLESQNLTRNPPPCSCELYSIYCTLL